VNQSLVLDRAAPFYVAGHRGMVGSAIWKLLAERGFENRVGATSTELDLRVRGDVFAFFETQRPRYVVLAAAKVGGILANSSFPNEFLSENVQIQTNVLDAALKYGVERLVFLGSSCIYPKFAPQPISESSLMTGPLERTNEAYAIAKIVGIVQTQSIRDQYGLPWISVMPCNLYGPGDNFSENGSHVLPALIRRFEEGRFSGAPELVNWGSGRPRREFLHVSDLAAGVLHAMTHYDGREHLNIGSGVDYTIAELSDTVARAVGYTGRVCWDTSKPDGTLRKLLDISRMQSLGWSPSIDIESGIRQTVDWYRERRQGVGEDAYTTVPSLVGEEG